MMSISTKDQPHPYNIVINGNDLIGMHSNPFLNSKLVNWLLSKHVLISGYDDDVRFAGEVWMEHQSNGLVFHLTNNSGTYKPNNEQLGQAHKFLSDAFPGLIIETHQNSDPVPSSPQSIDKQQTNIFTLFKHLFIILIPFIFYFIYKYFY